MKSIFKKWPFALYLIGWVAISIIDLHIVRSKLVSSWAAAFFETAYIILGSMLLAWLV